MNKRLTLEEIQKSELEILIEFDKICKKSNLKYGICGGTLLGAVRHKGFIPWDDDIDVEMPRPDYDKFIEISKNELPNHLVLQTPYTDKLTTHAYGKICDLRTTLFEFPDTKRIKTHLYIDIFPIDGLPKEIIKREKHRKKVHNLALILYGFRVSKYKKITTKNIFVNIFWMLVKLGNKMLQNNFLIKRVDKVAKEYNYKDSKFAGVIVAGYGSREMLPHIVCEFDNSIDFCNYTFMCTNKIDYYLTSIYGDYMKIPPVEQRICHDIECYKN